MERRMKNLNSPGHDVKRTHAPTVVPAYDQYMPELLAIFAAGYVSDDPAALTAKLKDLGGEGWVLLNHREVVAFALAKRGKVAEGADFHKPGTKLMQVVYGGTKQDHQNCGKRYATRLLIELERKCAEAGLETIEVLTKDTQLPAHKLLRKLGYKARMLRRANTDVYAFSFDPLDRKEPGQFL